MEIGPIIRTLGRNKTRFILIGIEVALTLAVVLNCVNMMAKMRRDMDRPTGIDESNIITVVSHPFSPDFKEEAYLDNARKADVELLRSLPGVRAAEVISAIPLSGSGSSSGYKPLGSTAHTLASGVFVTGPGALDTLGMRLVTGRNFVLSDINESESKNVIVTKVFADKLFPDGNALGKQIQGRTPDNPHTIVGILEHMHGSWPGWPFVSHVTLLPGKPGSFNWGVRYLIRTQPGQIDLVFRLIEPEMLKLNNGRNVTVVTLADVKADTFDAQINIIIMLGAVIFLLIFVTSLGIVGITSFSVTERTHHIGTRRALGARRLDIVRYFLTENWIITSAGIAFGVILTYALNLLLVNFVSGEKMDWRLVVAGILGMWIIGQLAAFFPAFRGTRISPATATRSV